MLTGENDLQVPAIENLREIGIAQILQIIDPKCHKRFSPVRRPEGRISLHRARATPNSGEA
jgi:hypothetical protein